MGSTHLKALKNVANAELAAVVSSDPRKLEGDLSGIQGNLGGPGEKMDFSSIKRYSSIDQALADPDIEAVDLCLPTDQHSPVALAALRAGKHVLVEKPMALTGAAADEMIAEAEKRKRILMAAQVLRFFPSYRAAADLVKSGRLGAVRAALFQRRCAAPAWSKWLANAEQSGGGVFDLLIHDVDFCVHLFGAPRAVTAAGYEDLPRGVDWILGRFEYPGIGEVAITGGWQHPKSYPFSMEFTIVCDGGTLEYSSSGMALTLFRADGEREVVDAGEVDGFQAELQYFTDCVHAGRQPELCPPRESATAVKLARLMVESRAKKVERMAWAV